MLVTNGKKTRNIADYQLAEYEKKGYKAIAEKTEPKKPEKKASK